MSKAAEVAKRVLELKGENYYGSSRYDRDVAFIAHEVEKLSSALAPFAAMGPLVEHTDKRDGECVHRQQRPDGSYFELTRDDFRRATAAIQS